MAALRARADERGRRRAAPARPAPPRPHRRAARRRRPYACTGSCSGCCTQPTVRVRQLAAEPGGDQYAALLRELFDLDVPQPPVDGRRPDAVEVRPTATRTGARAMSAPAPRHPGQRAGAGPVRHRRRRADRRHRPRRSSWSRSSPPATAPRAPVPQLGVGVFVSALRDALLAKEIDFAVHSYKDLPTAAGRRAAHRGGAGRARTRATRWSPGTAAPWPSCRPGARIGTGALRRIAQLHALGLRLEVAPIRGNVDTRLRRCSARRPTSTRSSWPGPGWPARPGRRDHRDRSTRCSCCPRPPRARWRWSAGPTTQTWSSCSPRSTTQPTRAAVTAERALLATLEAGCSAPVAALADVAEGDDGR